MNINQSQIKINLQDEEWAFEYTDHDREIVRAIVFDDDGYLYFVRAERDDDFGKAKLIETAGGGVESGEDLHTAIIRELKEELGVEADILCKIGVVDDYYNLIHRHNINNYYLCRAKAFGDKNLTEDEIKSFHLSTLKRIRKTHINKNRQTCCKQRITNFKAGRGNISFFKSK